AITDWVGMPAPLFANFPTDDDPGVPVRGSDVLVLRYFAPTGAQVTSFTPGTPATIRFEASQSGRLTEGLATPGLFAIADCMQAAVFRANRTNMTTGLLTVASGGLNQSSFAATTPFTSGQSMVYRAESM